MYTGICFTKDKVTMYPGICFTKNKVTMYSGKMSYTRQVHEDRNNLNIKGSI